MKIQITENIRLKQSSRDAKTWDVLRVYTGVRKGVEVEVEKPMAYGRKLEDCIQDIFFYDKRVSDKRLVELKEFLEEYKKTTEEVEASLNNFVQQLNNN